ncbi:MAG: crossover junction endodeoxyribonuclease RuvC [Candidatus Aminicenantes bacterium]|nr:crossover junction endodeoxyribonuclease RuvC [Candidatus Aminicenantes bacterium]
MRVLGIDPGSLTTGYGLLEETENCLSVVTQGVIKVKTGRSLSVKLNKIRLDIEEILRQYTPEEVAIENPFYARNIKTAITLGQVRGAILVAVASHGCSLFEYSPREIKKAVTGYGQAEKSQVMAMVKALLHLQEIDLEPDAADALAAAFCHLSHRRSKLNLEKSRL